MTTSTMLLKFLATQVVGWIIAVPCILVLTRIIPRVIAFVKAIRHKIEWFGKYPCYPRYMDKFPTKSTKLT